MKNEAINLDGINPLDLQKPIESDAPKRINLPIENSTDALTNKREKNLIYNLAIIKDADKEYAITVGYSQMSYAVVLAQGKAPKTWADIKGRFRITEAGWWKSLSGWRIFLFVLKHNLTRLF